MNIGEEICGEWLRHVRKCEFIQYNVKTRVSQGEIDVIGINLNKRIVYACEVAVHLITGLQYTKGNRPDNLPRLREKFRRDVKYIRTDFPDYEHVFMFWSPVVKNQRSGAKYNQVNDVECLIEEIQRELIAKESIERVINKNYLEAIEALRNLAGKETKELSGSPVMRFLQVEEHLKKHLKRQKTTLHGDLPQPSA